LQVALAARVVPQELVPGVIAKSVGLVPASAMLLMFSVALPVLERAADCAAVVVPVAAVKLSDAGVSVATGAAAAAPVPVIAEDCVVGAALSVTMRVPV
jgi:hypothetical protein